MSSTNKNIVIAVVVALLILALYSYKKNFVDVNTADAAKAEINRQLQNAPANDNLPPPQGMPSSAGLHQPGNKNH